MKAVLTVRFATITIFQRNAEDFRNQLNSYALAVMAKYDHKITSD